MVTAGAVQVTLSNSSCHRRGLSYELSRKWGTVALESSRDKLLGPQGSGIPTGCDELLGAGMARPFLQACAGPRSRQGEGWVWTHGSRSGSTSVSRGRAAERPGSRAPAKVKWGPACAASLGSCPFTLGANRATEGSDSLVGKLDPTALRVSSSSKNS